MWSEIVEGSERGGLDRWREGGRGGLELERGGRWELEILSGGKGGS